MAWSLSAYQIKYLFVSRAGPKRWFINGSVTVLGIDELEAVKNARPRLELERTKLLQRTTTIDRHFPGYDLEVRLVTKLPFHLPALTSEERLIPAFNYLGAGIFLD